MTSKVTIGATEITALLAKRHSEDVFVSQCKTGPTQTSSAELLILDAWALKRSWSNPRSDGYEIKVDRGDFLRDEKWEGYREFCTHFWFVCPHGVIAKEELPWGVGLVYVTKTGRSLRTVRKAARGADVDALHPALAQYVLQSRARIRPAWEGQRPRGAEYWREWLAQRRSQKELGSEVAAEFAVRFGELQIKSNQIHERNQQLEKVQAWLNEAGIDLERQRWDLEEAVRQQIAPETAREVGEKVQAALEAAQLAVSHAGAAKRVLEKA